MPSLGQLVSRIRRPVRREGVERYLLLTLLSFGGSVAGTRLFLELAGYPQLGGGELHIAHVLWGGLLLFLAALLPLIYSNRWVYSLGAVLAGVGVGLFIDEVGKFITQNNDYFHPIAAPIVYASFLLTVLLYFQVRRPISPSDRAELYRALDAMEEVLDHDLDPEEHRELDARLRRVAANAGSLAYARLAGELLEFLHSQDLQIAAQVPSTIDRMKASLLQAESRWLNRPRLKAALVGALTGVGGMPLLKVGGMLMGSTRIASALAGQIAAGHLASSQALQWFTAQLALQASVGLLLLLGAALLLLGKDRGGLRLAYFGLLLSLTVVNLLIFYFEQFSTIIGASLDLVVLLGVLYYRNRFVTGALA